jgi:hypothetical protein
MKTLQTARSIPHFKSRARIAQSRSRKLLGFPIVDIRCLGAEKLGPSAVPSAMVNFRAAVCSVFVTFDFTSAYRKAIATMGPIFLPPSQYGFADQSLSLRCCSRRMVCFDSGIGSTSCAPHDVHLPTGVETGIRSYRFVAKVYPKEAHCWIDALGRSERRLMTRCH